MEIHVNLLVSSLPRGLSREADAQAWETQTSRKHLKLNGFHAMLALPPPIYPHMLSKSSTQCQRHTAAPWQTVNGQRPQDYSNTTTTSPQKKKSGKETQHRFYLRQILSTLTAISELLMYEKHFRPYFQELA